MAKNILICDDAAFMRMMIKDILTKNGYTVAGEAENGAKAVEKYTELKPDLVLMDITMPEMDGIQALKKIRELDPKASVIMCSAMGQQAMVIESIQAGAKDFFDWLTPLREGHLDQSLREAFTIAGYIFYAACENIRKANILLLAGPKLDAQIVNDMGIRKYDRMEDIMADIDIKDKDVYIIPFGGSVMPQTEADYSRYSEEI